MHKIPINFKNQKFELVKFFTHKFKVKFLISLSFKRSEIIIKSLRFHYVISFIVI